MKHFYFLLLFFGLNAFSMNFSQSFIIKRGGVKININPNFFRVDDAEEVVFYKLENSEVERKISFKDFEYILIGKNKFKIFKLNNSKEINGYFVLSETALNSLILSTKLDDENSDLVRYNVYIVDLNCNIIDSLEFDNLKTPKSASVRADIFSKIQFYFKDCKLLMDRISSFDNTSFLNLDMDILGFFDSPVYFECL